MSYFPTDMYEAISDFFKDKDQSTQPPVQGRRVPFVVSKDFKVSDHRVKYHFQGMTEHRGARNVVEQPPTVVVEGHIKDFVYSKHDKARKGVINDIETLSLQSNSHSTVPIGIFGIVSTRTTSKMTEISKIAVEFLPHNGRRNVRLRDIALH